MTVTQAIILGIVQGLAEFLPISSSAHLSLAPWLLGWEDSGLAFDVSLHVGTLAAVIWYFRREWMALAQAAWSIVATRSVTTLEQRRVVFLVIATIPGAVAGLMLEDYAETVFRAPIITAIALITLGIILWAVDTVVPERRGTGELRWTDAVLIGMAQALALVPGVSRSGATITAGRALGLDRSAAAVFSFLMSMPIIAAAAVFKVPQAIQEGGLSAPLVAGVLASAVSGWFAIAVLLRFVMRHSYAVFAIYRVAFGAFVLWLIFARV